MKGSFADFVAEGGDMLSIKRFVLVLFALLTVCFFGVCPAIAQTSGGKPSVPSGAMAGHVTDTSSAVLQGAKIKVDPGKITAVTNEEGRFFVAGLAPGDYSITISFLAFKDFTKSVTVIAGQTLQVDAVMEVAAKSQQVVVTTEVPHGEALALNRQENADNIVQVSPAEVITSLPNANIADAVGRMAGVTLERDEGEGKYIQIRGTEPRLTNVTIDGINVPSPEGTVRQIELDTVPADLVDSIEINDTLQANMDGDGIGGSVNLVTKTAGEVPTINVFSSLGYTPIDNGRKTTDENGTLGYRFGAQKKFGVIIGGHYDWNGRGIDDIEPVPDELMAPNGSLSPYYESMDLREYVYYRTRWGLAGSVDYKLREDSSIYARALYSNFEDYGNKWVFTVNDNSGLPQCTPSPTPTPCLGEPNSVPATPVFKSTSRRPELGIGSFVVGGRHVFSSRWVSWEASVARSREFASAGNPGPDFTDNLTTSACMYNPSQTASVSIYRPQWTPVCYTEAYNQANYSLQDIVLSEGKTAQLNLQGAASIGQRYHIGGHLATFEFGAKYRTAHKFDDSYTLGFAPTVNLPDTMFLDSYGNSNYYDKTYSYGAVTDYNKILAYFAQNPGNFMLEPYNPNGNTTIGGNPINFDYVEKIPAGYVMNTIDLGRFRLVAGLRVEGTVLDTYTFQANANATAPGGFIPAVGSYVEFLPSLSLRYSLTPNSALRLVYSRGLSRPDPQDIAEATSIDTSSVPTSVALGNPNLKAETANNYDLLYEHYFNQLGMLRGGFFYKQLHDPIVESTVSQLLSTGEFAGDAITQPVNAGSAWVTGVEASFLKNFTSLPGPLAGLGLSANYTHTASQASGLQQLGRSDSPALLRQAPNFWNIGPTYNYKRLFVALGMTYNGASIYAYQYTDGTGDSSPSPFGIKGPFGDNYLYPHFQIDAQSDIELPKNFTMIVDGLNLNNEVFGFYNGSPQFVVQREYYHPTYSLGLRWSPRGEK
jgi:TonB-dependent receptor